MEGFNFGSSYNAAYAPTPKRKQRDDDVDMIFAKRAHQGVSSLTPLMRGAGLRSPGLSPGQRNAFDALRCPRGASVQLAAAAPAVLFAATCATCATKLQTAMQGPWRRRRNSRLTNQRDARTMWR